MRPSGGTFYVLGNAQDSIVWSRMAILDTNLGNISHVTAGHGYGYGASDGMLFDSLEQERRQYDGCRYSLCERQVGRSNHPSHELLHASLERKRREHARGVDSLRFCDNGCSGDECAGLLFLGVDCEWRQYDGRFYSMRHW